MLEVKIITCSVQRDARELYERLWHPQTFPQWAAGLSRAALEQDEHGWKAQGPAGPIRITFTPHNAFGIMDHWVDPGDAPVVSVPMRIVPNGEGSEVTVTLFRQSDMSDEQFANDQALVRQDLEALKVLVEAPAAP